MARARAHRPTPIKDGAPPVVGIGASAGGVQALQTFFESLPADLGLAYVVILHLAPDRESELGHILSMRTSMPVTSVDKPQPLEANHVYVIPPDHSLSITHEQSPPIASPIWRAGAGRSTSSSGRWPPSTATVSR